MRVLQIIDSLDAGGAERMAVNFANGLCNKIQFSGIVVTRKEGNLQNHLHKDVDYYFLNKKKNIDFDAIKKLKKIVVENKIEIIHAHGTSFFIVFLLKIVHSKIKIIYHEHYGNRANQSKYKNSILLFCLLFFNQILVVNKVLEKWFINFGFKKVNFFPNFTSFNQNDICETKLLDQDGKRIILLANLKNPKNHILLLEAFNYLDLKRDNWSLHFVGKIFKDNYSEKILNFINKFNLNECVYLYDIKSDIKNILSQANIGVLCSTDEGFPVTLLEYGLAKLPVISSNVGFCPEIIIDKKNGLLFESNNVTDLSINLKSLILNKNSQIQFGENLHLLVKEKYSDEVVLKNYLVFLQNLTNTN